MRSPAAVACALLAPAAAGDWAGVRRWAARGRRPRRRARPARRLAAPAAAPIDQGPARACGGVRARADAAAPVSRRPGCAHAAGVTVRLVTRALRAITTTSPTSSSRSPSPRPTAMNIERVAQHPGGARTLEEAHRAQARVRLRQARARARRARASAAAAAAASRSTLLPLAALRWSGSLCPSPRGALRAAPGGAGWRRRPGRDPRDGLPPAHRRALRRGREHRHG